MKRCCTCKVVFPATNEHFSQNRAMADGFCQMCRPCDKARKKKNRPSKEKIRAASNRRYDDFCSFLAVLKSGGCERCGEADVACLEFHHKDRASKKYNVSKMASRTRHAILDELEKCEILCANCHAMHESGVNRPASSRNSKLIAEYKASTSCGCGESRPEVLEFHHRDPVRGSGRRIGSMHQNSRERILAEIAKCDVMCGNCHSRHHYTK